MDRSFAGQVAVVTGASSGIGRALARQFAAQGAKVGLIARRQGELEALAQAIRSKGGEALAAPADVTDLRQVEPAMDAIREALGPIDVLITSAGVGMPTLLDPVNVADVEAMFRVNVLGMVHAITCVLPEMLRRGRGRLAGVSSLSAYLSLPGESAYCASKAAVNAYLAGLRGHLRGRGVSVTTLCPGFVETAMTADNPFHMPGLLTAEEAARRMLRAVAKRQGVVNFPWHVSVLTRLVARLPERFQARLMAGYNEAAAQRFAEESSH